MSEGIQRFVDAQADGVYEKALREIRSGYKRTHWVWFVFPQIVGLGSSFDARRYGISGLDEAREYMQHPVLSQRLVQISQALLDLQERDPVAILGSTDAKKVRSCMTLFELVSDQPVFGQVLEEFYGGQRDDLTLELVDAQR